MSLLPSRPLSSHISNQSSDIFATLIKTLFHTAVLTSFLLLISACDTKNTTENVSGNNEIPITTSESTSANSKNEQNKVAPNSNQQTSDDTNANSLDKKAVSPLGYAGLSFGQTITPEIISSSGLTKGNHGYDECYYLEDASKDRIKRDGAVFKPIYYQVIDGRLALIGVNAPDIDFFTGIRNGDKADKIIAAHPNNLSYSMDKYDYSGDYYHFIYDIPTPANTLPLQIKYTMKGGKKIANASSVAHVDKWSTEQRAQLQGQVETIELGIPDAIMLVEGCS